MSPSSKSAIMCVICVSFYWQTLDGGMYEKLSEYFSIISRTELITCSAWQNSYGKIKDQANSVIGFSNFVIVIVCCFNSIEIGKLS